MGQRLYAKNRGQMTFMRLPWFGNGELDRADAIQTALGFQLNLFERGCDIALSIVA